MKKNQNFKVGITVLSTTNLKKIIGGNDETNTPVDLDLERDRDNGRPKK